MVIIDSSKICDAVEKAFTHIGCNIDNGVINKLKNAYKCESNPVAKFALDIMLKNDQIAKSEKVPACQDTGMAVVFVDIGDEVFVQGNIEDAVNRGVRKAYEVPFRKSVLDPLSRINTGDNTPAVIHLSQTKGSSVTVHCMAKGFGSENMSRLFMLPPSAGIEGIKESILQSVKEAGGCPCPPVIVGVGIGGTMEKASIMSKRALLREIDSINQDEQLAELEKELLIKLNQLNVGAMGYGGATTAVGVFIEKYPTHIAGLPIAITIQCHCQRHMSIEIKR